MGLISRSRDRLVDDGWVQEEFREDGSHCLIGILRVEAGCALWSLDVTDEVAISHMVLKDEYRSAQKLIHEVIVEQYPAFGKPVWDETSRIMQWNDDPGREFTEVLAILEKAEAREAESSGL